MCCPFLLTDSLGVHIHCCANVRVPEQFALHLYIRAIGPQERAVAVAERVPAYPLRDSRTPYSIGVRSAPPWLASLPPTKAPLIPMPQMQIPSPLRQYLEKQRSLHPSRGSRRADHYELDGLSVATRDTLRGQPCQKWKSKLGIVSLRIVSVCSA